METEELEKSLYSCVGRQQSGEQELTNNVQGEYLPLQPVR
jgi:hypothetical protein